MVFNHYSQIQASDVLTLTLHLKTIMFLNEKILFLLLILISKLFCSGDDSFFYSYDENEDEHHNSTLTTAATPTINCSKGYSLLTSVLGEERCVDIDECKIFGKCSQLCENYNGSFSCSCEEGFTATPDDQTLCALNDPSWKLLFATQTNIGQIIHEKSGMEYKSFNLSEGHSEISYYRKRGYRDITYDVRSNVVYWTRIHDPGVGIIYRKSFEENSTTEIIADSGIRTPEGIAFDWITGNIYYFDTSFGYIGVCNNGSQSLCCPVIKTGSTYSTSVADIALHPNLRIMFWVADGIIKSGMDGSNRVKILNVQYSEYKIAGITIDHLQSRLYFPDNDILYGSIITIDFNGSNLKKIRPISSGYSRTHYHGSSQFKGIDVVGDQVFWANNDNPRILSANKFTGLSEKVHSSGGMSNFQSLIVVHPINQPITRNNSCLKANCSHTCVLSPISPSTPEFRCLCPVGMTLSSDMKTCVDTDDSNMLLVAHDNVFYVMRFNSTGRNVFSSITLPTNISIKAFVHSPVRNSIIFYDEWSKRILEYDLAAKSIQVLADECFVKDITFDDLSQNVYWLDERLPEVEIMSLITMKRMVLIKNLINPSHILVLPHLGSIFISQLEGISGTIRQTQCSGKKNHMVLRVQHAETVGLVFDAQTNQASWIYYQGGRDKESISMAGLLSGRISRTIRITWYVNSITHMILYGSFVCWAVFTESDKIFCSDKWLTEKEVQFKMHNLTHASQISKLGFLYKNISHLKDKLEHHECSIKSSSFKNCSHICVPTGQNNKGECICPLEMFLKEDGRTCEYSPCKSNSFVCFDGACVDPQRVCDGLPDCLKSEDEFACDRDNEGKDNSTLSIIIALFSSFGVIVNVVFFAIILIKLREFGKRSNGLIALEQFN